MIRLEQLTKSYDDRVVVDGVSLSVAEGELLFLVGGSGSGKTTTLKMINRLVEPSGGRVLIGGEDVARRVPWELRRSIGYVFQDIGLFPHLTVGENVAVTPSLLGWERERIERGVEEWLERVELEPAVFRDRFPAALSGGQQQRVALARALAAGPSVVLLDEPFGGLDPLTRDRIQGVFDALRRATGLTGVFVSHDMAEALRLADRIAVLRHGRLVQVGPPAELVANPAHEDVARLLSAPARQAAEFERVRRQGGG